MYSFTGKNVIVIGGTSGIGLTVARSFVEQGADVVVTGRRAEGGQVAEAAGASFIRSDATD
jgi:NAD(P)-dependent dehydrogenase (short-subunit alcohol dehydrogenase family)